MSIYLMFGGRKWEFRMFLSKAHRAVYLSLPNVVYATRENFSDLTEYGRAKYYKTRCKFGFLYIIDKIPDEKGRYTA